MNYEVYDIENCEVVFEGSYSKCKDYAESETVYVVRRKGDQYFDLSDSQLDWIQKNIK